MAKKSWNEVRTKFSGDNPGLTRVKSPGDNNPSRDISAEVEANAKINGGVSAPLRKPPNWNKK